MLSRLRIQRKHATSKYYQTKGWLIGWWRDLFTCICVYYETIFPFSLANVPIPEPISKYLMFRNDRYLYSKVLIIIVSQTLKVVSRDSRVVKLAVLC